MREATRTFILKKQLWQEIQSHVKGIDGDLIGINKKTPLGESILGIAEKIANVDFQAVSIGKEKIYIRPGLLEE